MREAGYIEYSINPGGRQRGRGRYNVTLVVRRSDMKLTGQQACFLAVISLTFFSVFTYFFSKSPTNLQRPRVVNIVTTLRGFQEAEPEQLSVQVAESKLQLAESKPSNISLVTSRPLEKKCNVSTEPVLSIVPWQRVTYPGKLWKGLQLPMITIGSSGRLGNLMGNYASIFGLGRAYNTTVRIDVALQKQLAKIFPRITIPSIDTNASMAELQSLPYLGNYVYGDKEAAAAGLLGAHAFLAKGYPIEIQLFHAYGCEIRNEFTFAPDIQEKVRQFWLAKKNLITDTVLVGFHIRRKDYLKYVKHRGEQMPNQTYYSNAMKFYKDKFSKVVFVVGSDDTKYIKGEFKGRPDVIFVPGKSPEEDMAILASCNHSIITVGTFGFWTAYLAGGLVVYPGDFYIPNYPLQKDRYERAGMDLFVPIPRT